MDFDVIIVGSGPAGVSAALPLAEAGVRVALLEGGPADPPPVWPDGDYQTLRRGDADQWRFFLGADLAGVRPQPLASPKFRVPALQAALARFAGAWPIETTDFHAVGALAPGGLSRAWGAGVACFTDADLGADSPIAAADLADAYRRVAARIGIAGRADDDLGDFFGAGLPLQPANPLSENARRLLDRYGRAPGRAGAHGLSLGRARNAVLSEPLGGRGGCRQCGFCLWGCPDRAIYSAADELPGLAARGVTVLTDCRVMEIAAPPAGPRVRVLHAGLPAELSARRVLLAAGALGSARLALAALGHHQPVPLLSTPTAGFAVWLPERLGAAPDGRAFPLAQVSYRVDLGDGLGDGFGNLFSTDGLPVHEFVRLSPLSIRAGAAIFPLLLPSLLVGNCFLPGALSRHALSVGADGRMRISGGFAPALGAVLGRVRRAVGGALRAYGLFALPGGFRVGAPGTDLHYAATLPMRRQPAPHQTDALGALPGLPGVHVVDAAALPALPAKAHTFTAMANAERIARRLAADLAG